MWNGVGICMHMVRILLVGVLQVAAWVMAEIGGLEAQRYNPVVGKSVATKKTFYHKNRHKKRIHPGKCCRNLVDTFVVQISSRLSRTDRVCGPRKFYQSGCRRQVLYKGREVR